MARERDRSIGLRSWQGQRPAIWLANHVCTDRPRSSLSLSLSHTHTHAHFSPFFLSFPLARIVYVYNSPSLFPFDTRNVVVLVVQLILAIIVVVAISRSVVGAFPNTRTGQASVTERSNSPANTTIVLDAFASSWFVRVPPYARSLNIRVDIV